LAPLPQALPLTTFERIMWYDDHRRLPMTFRLELVFDGLLDRQAFNAAFAAASARHPLLQAVVVRRWGRLWWMPAERSASVIWVDSFSPAPANAWEGIQPWREPGVRIIASEVPSDEVPEAADCPVDRAGMWTRCTFLFHHTAVDGLGALLFVGELMASYHELLTGKSVPRDPDLTPEPRLLPWRDGLSPVPAEFQISPEAPAELSQELIPESVRPPSAEVSRETWKFVTFFPQAMLPPAKPRRDPLLRRAAPLAGGLATGWLNVDDSRRLRERATRDGMPPNAWMLAQLYETQWRWNEQRGRPRAQQRTRVTVPVSLRDGARQRLPAANCMSYLNINARARDTQSVGELRQKLHQFMVIVAQQGWAAIFVEQFRGVDWIPGLIALGSRLPWGHSSMVFSNIGHFRRRIGARLPTRQGTIQMGNVQMVSVFGSPPIRYGTSVSIGAGIYQDRIGFGATACPQTFGRAGAQAFLDEFLDDLRESVRDRGTNVAAGSWVALSAAPTPSNRLRNCR
jgi:hypothetical protein